MMLDLKHEQLHLSQHYYLNLKGIKKNPNPQQNKKRTSNLLSSDF